ncbi:MAG: hypothetical protein ABSA79_05720 [Candidatus Bathyarchaeia archaeon]|jgi:hypothetical protein
MDATVIKIGGSLALHPEKLKILGSKLSAASKKQKILVVPGGGEFADVVRAVDKRFSLSDSVSHQMAILGMDQYGFLLSNLISGSQAINQFDQVQIIFDSHKCPIFLPSNSMLKNGHLEKSWNVTSDSIAVYIANLLHIKKVILVTDVDGIFTRDPKKHSNAQLICEISAKQLEAMSKRTSVDKFLPKLLLRIQIECFVVNGLFPERVEDILDGRNAVCTIIN